MASLQFTLAPKTAGLDIIGTACHYFCMPKENLASPSIRSFRLQNAPSHLFAIQQLSFLRTLQDRNTEGDWFCLGAYSHGFETDKDGVQVTVERKCLLIPKGSFRRAYPLLRSVGDTTSHMGRPSPSLLNSAGKKRYYYAPFHKFHLGFANLVGEPLVFVRPRDASNQLVINQDIILFLRLEERVAGSGIWWDASRGQEAVRHHRIDDLEAVDISSEHLMSYLRARQMSLLIGHYSHRHFYNPPQCVIDEFVTEDVIVGSPKEELKAIFQNWGLRTDCGEAPFLQRRLHLWFEIKAPQIDLDDPWAEVPTFDPYSFTLPTREGIVAPARWAHFKKESNDLREFAGVKCDFMTNIYFRQEVLIKYETMAGYDVRDNGSVSCRDIWGLDRGTRRLGNELIGTAIGDFAEGVPFREWQHWQQYAVQPPSYETLESLRGELSICEAVNQLGSMLQAMNRAFSAMAFHLGATVTGSLWKGDINSLAGRQLKWVYPHGATDDEFIKRATLTSTLVIDELSAKSMRELLRPLGDKLHLKGDTPLGSRSLLQKLVLATVLIHAVRPDLAELPSLIDKAEDRVRNAQKSDLQHELEQLTSGVRADFASLAYLYDFRTYGGFAHPPNVQGIAETALKLGLSEKDWQRKDFLQLILKVTASISKITERFSSVVMG